MASPLLEAGAIDGARGILINISGSSSLKLSEVNEASTLIQNSAHEEANIIFGAVLDESMGDEVKITVIATGFRQEMPERREKMLNVGLREPAAPEMSAPPSRPKFASEEESDEEPTGFSQTHLDAEPPEPAFAEANEPARQPEPAVVEEASAPVEVAVAVAEAAPPTVLLSAAHEEEQEQNLDIPAFMRRGGL
jgi:cell division protein FtsZ